MSVTLGPYTLTHVIADGGMARIFLANERGLEGVTRRVVVKCILQELTSDPAYLRLLVDEARLVAQLRHQNIVQLFGLHHADGVHFIVLEWIDGLNTYELCQALAADGRRLPLPVALFLSLEMLRGLHAAHTATAVDGTPLAIVHRDLSPGNVLVSKSGEVKVADFGVAKWAHQTTRTRTGELKGKFVYMAPEQARAKAVDTRTDVYTAGLVIFEWLTGVRANPGRNETDALEFARKSELRREELATLPADLASIIAKAIEPDSDARFASAADLAQALRDSKTARLQPATNAELAALVNAYPRQPLVEATSDDPIVADVAQARTIASQIAAPTPPARKRSFTGPAVAAIIAALVLVVAATLATRPSPAPVRPTPASAPVVVAATPTSQPAVVAATPEPAPGYLSINSRPWAVVFIDGVRVPGTTPLLDHRVSPGAHKIRLEAKGIGARRELELKIGPGEHVARIIEF